MNTLWSVLCGGTLHSVAFVLRALGVPVVANGNVLSSPSFSAPLVRELAAALMKE